MLKDSTMQFIEMNFDKLKWLIPIVVEQFAYNPWKCIEKKW
jgi:hypothetical protein